jgi:16S rRNA (uracil1498-N3)-methyltransferase
MPARIEDGGGDPRSGQRRYWAAEVDLERGRAWLDAAEARHALRVLRHRAGDRIQVIDGSGRLFEVVIGESEDGPGGVRRLAGRIVAVREPEPAATLPWLVQALIRPARLKALIDGATQLGVAGVLLFAGEHTSVPARLTAGRRERLLRIMRAATAQSLGVRLPELRGPMSFAELPAALAGFRVWVAHGPRAEGAIAAPHAAEAKSPHALVVGPEGGLTDSEVAELIQCGARILDLGPRRLRSETAALAGLTLLSATLRGARPSL